MFPSPRSSRSRSSNEVSERLDPSVLTVEQDQDIPEILGTGRSMLLLPSDVIFDLHPKTGEKCVVRRKLPTRDLLE